MKKYLVAMLAALLTACGGGGGGSSPTAAQQTTPASTPAAPVTPAAPLKVQASSYENKVAASNAIGPQALPSEVIASNAAAFGDFFQDGTYSMVTMTCGDVSCYVNGQAGNGQPGTIHFYKNVGGKWVDHTSDILANNVGCLHPRKAIVADFNNSKKPGVFFACIGVDANPYNGEQPILLLPQADGQYTVTKLPFTGYFHSASAADVNGSGYADIVVADRFEAKTPYFLKNNGDGTFTADSRLPKLTKYQGSVPVGAQIYETELINFGTGKYDLFLGGVAVDGGGDWNPTIFKNNGDNTYSMSNTTVLPDNAQYPLSVDILYVNGATYTTNVQVNSSNSGYGYSDIEKNGSTLWQGNAPFASKQTWINWIIPYNGLIASMDSTDQVQVSQ